jgi:hypothetical protein
LIGPDAERLLDELLSSAVLENLAAAITDGLNQAGQVLSRVESRLPFEPNAGSANERHLVHERSIEAEIDSQCRLFLEALLRRAIRRAIG